MAIKLMDVFELITFKDSKYCFNASSRTLLRRLERTSGDIGAIVLIALLSNNIQIKFYLLVNVDIFGIYS